LAADEAGIGYLLDTFDASTMLLPGDGLHRFLLHLDEKAADLLG
jgi:hypothetical protein